MKMKRTLALLLGIVALASVPATQQVGNVSSRTWARRFGGLSEDRFRAVSARSDSGLFLAGGSWSFGPGSQDAWVARLDRRGRTVWESVIGTPDYDEAFAVLATPDGGCLVAGTLTPAAGIALSDGWLVKLDALGEVTWQKSYASADDEILFALALSPDGYYVGGGISDADGEDTDAWVLEVDGNGDVLWQERFTTAGFDTVASIAATDQGLVVVANTSASLPGGPGAAFFRPWLIALDGAGAPLWQKTYDVSGGDYWSRIAVLADGSFVVTGEVLAAAFFGGDVWVVRLDASGDVLWDRRFGDNFGLFDFDTGWWVRPGQDGGFVVLAASQTARDRVWLLGLDAAGERLWDRSYDVGPSSDPAALDVAPNGDLLVIGSTTTTNDVDSFALRLAPNGRGPRTCELNHATDPNEWQGEPVVFPIVLPPSATSHAVSATGATRTSVDSGLDLCAPIGG